jgi:hypothetical protein
MCLEFAPLGGSDHEEMIDMTGIALGDKTNGDVGECSPVLNGELAPPVRPPTQPGKSSHENGRLNLVQARIDSLILVMITVSLSAVS